MIDATFERERLPIDGDFTISRGSKAAVETVVVRVRDDAGQTGIGAAAPDPHYGETADTVCAVLPDLLEAVEGVDDPLALDRIERELRDVVRDNPAARAAVSVACHDLATRRLGIPLYRYLGLDAERAPPTSYTVAIDDPEAMGEAAADAVDAGYDVLKVKLGTARDRERVEAVREAAPEATVRVDANEAWTPAEAIRKSEWLADLGVEFVEQPVPAENPEGLRRVTGRSALPVAADESCVTLPDIAQVADRVDIVNLKLMKCGGVREAVRMVHAARAHGLEVMLGCMVESTASLAAACHLAPLVDYVDLDGALLLAENPYDGPSYAGGSLAFPDRPGTGVRSD
ncbi:L-alanine-DL-glutamate epimerase [Haloplanus vescus]|uniref:L-alanine-DL-glutamate epimerase n=1 Tax=Haloplanus vescus TaxID=555874 RepID=A0A1H4AKQ5_9EURY|nr:dipeptide epimerase [Haloplanus vescus]SEA36569.1 L-alanine-DL-glutamate epimerase [Haloplanus vescus]